MKDGSGIVKTRQGLGDAGRRDVVIDLDDMPAMTEAELAAVKIVPRVKTLRRVLRLTQEEFAARYGIPLGTLRDWEQGAKEPDTAARSYIRCIMGDPEGVAAAFLRIPPAPGW